MRTILVYETDFGTVRLPDDYPASALRKDGFPDRRRKMAASISEYNEDLIASARKLWSAGKRVHGMQAINWVTWQPKKS